MSKSPFQFTYRSPRSSLMYTLPIRRLKDILSLLHPKLTLSSVDEIPSTRLPRLYHLNLTDGKRLVLSFAPSLAVRLLRHELTLLSCEAAVIHFLSGMDRCEPDMALPPSLKAVAGAARSPGMTLAQMIPSLVKHSSSTTEMGYPYSIFEPGTGVPLAELLIYLSLPEQRRIDRQIGALVRDLARLTSPTGKFGAASRVCVDADAAGPAASSTSPERGSKDWIGAFMSLVEGILRDGEDMSVLLPYEIIRMHFHRLSWRLKAVTVPRLVVMDVGEATNVLIERGSAASDPSAADGPTVTGLRDWSHGIFGDPLLSSCFEDPSDGFLEGWRGDDAAAGLIDDDDDGAGDGNGSATRLLLYRCYRAIVAIVTEYYRPQLDSSRRELEGRRKLTAILAELDRVDLGGQTDFVKDFVKRARSASPPTSGADVEAKRQKL